MEGQSNSSDSLYLCKSGSRRKGGEEVETDSKENLTLTLLAVGIVIIYDEAGRDTRKRNCEETLSAAPLCSCHKA